jgi:hypothetical protein
MMLHILQLIQLSVNGMYNAALNRTIQQHNSKWRKRVCLGCAFEQQGDNRRKIVNLMVSTKLHISLLTI